MKHFFIAALLIFCIMPCLTACGKDDENADTAQFDAVSERFDAGEDAKRDEETQQEPGQGEVKHEQTEQQDLEQGKLKQEQTEQQDLEQGKVKQEQMEYIGEVPSNYFKSCKKQGKVRKVTYKSRDYTSKKRKEIKKTAFVYQPYGYDKKDTSKRYDILYLMHGWTMTAGDFFNSSGSDIVNMLDNMIESGDIQPLIVVCATFDAENKSQDFARSVSELSVFHNDLRENLIPYIESRYNTYAEDTDDSSLKESRQHRAFGGFSLGAVTTWHQFVYNLEYIKYFVPMSGGCWFEENYDSFDRPVEIVNYLENIMNEKKIKENDFRIYQGIGTNDPIWDLINGQVLEMMKREMFTLDNLHYAVIKGGKHDLDACERILFYALKDFFGVLDT